MPSRPFLVVIITLLAIFLVVQAGWFYQLEYCNTQQDGQHVESQVWHGWICGFLAEPVTVFTFCLLLCNVVLFGFIMRQIEQTDASIRLTADAHAANRFVQSGRFALVRVEDPPLSLEGMLSKEIPIAFAYENSGSSEVRMHGMRAGIDAVSNLDDIAVTAAPAVDPFAKTIRPNEYFSTEEMHGRVCHVARMKLVIKEDLFLKYLNGQYLVLLLRFEYSTTLGDRYIHSDIVVRKSAWSEWRIYSETPYTFVRPASEVDGWLPRSSKQ